jgi:hypothetical protein
MDKNRILTLRPHYEEGKDNVLGGEYLSAKKKTMMNTPHKIMVKTALLLTNPGGRHCANG